MNKINAKELEKKFDNGDDVSEYMDFSKVRKLSDVFKSDNNTDYEEVNIFFPKSFIKIMDKKIHKIGINREAFIKMIIAEKLDIIQNYSLNIYLIYQPYNLMLDLFQSQCFSY